MKPEGWTRNMRCESAVEDLMQPSEELGFIEDWGVELGEHFKEALRRKVRAPWWSHEGAGRDAMPEVEANEGTAEVMREGQDTLQVPSDVSVPRNRDGSLQRNSLQLDLPQAADATGQDVAEVFGLDAQTVEQPNLDVTPVRATAPDPIPQPGPLGPLDHGTTSNAQETGGEPQLAELHQDGHEAHVTEFSLLVGF